MDQDYASTESGRDASHAGEQTATSRTQFSQTTAKLEDQARDAADRVKEEGRRQAEMQKANAADTVDVLADAVDRASDELHRQNQDGLANYASQVAGAINDFAEKLRNRSVDELLSETQGLAHRSPAAFLLGSVGAGFALSRFLKASSHRETHRRSEVAEESSSDTESADGYAGESKADASPNPNEARATHPDIAGASGWVGGMLPPELEDSNRPNTH